MPKSSLRSTPLKRTLARLTLPLYVTATVLAGVTIPGAPVAFAADTLFSDDFGTGSNLNDIPNWEEQGNDSDSTTLAMAPTSGNDSASPNGGRFAFVDSDEWICREVNAAGYENLMLQYAFPYPFPVLM